MTPTRRNSAPVEIPWLTIWRMLPSTASWVRGSKIFRAGAEAMAAAILGVTSPIMELARTMERQPKMTSAMATVLLLSSRNPGRSLEWACAILISMLVMYGVFLMAIRLQRLLGEDAITAMERLMGLVLTAIAVEMLLGGVTSYIRHIPVR